MNDYTPEHVKEEPKASPLHVAEWAKAYVSLIGAVATGLMAMYGPDTTVGQVLTVIVIVTTAVATWAVPNRDT